MIEYAMGQHKASPDMAVDVLMSGLSYSSPEADPLGCARLHLALASVEAERNNWGTACSHAGSSLALTAPRASATPAVAELAIGAGGLGARAALLQGQDAEACALAAQCERALRPCNTASPSPSDTTAAASSTAHTRSLALLALATRAAEAAPPERPAAPAAAERAAAETPPSPACAPASASGQEVVAKVPAPPAEAQLAAALGRDPAAAASGEPAAADALHALGLLRAAGGQAEAAAAAFGAAAATAAAARSAEGGRTGAAGLGWLLQQHNHEVEADALTGSAQLQMAAKEWGQAEELLGAALKAAEAAHGEHSPALAPLLALLGYTYSRSARVTFAEGLFREAAKLLRLDPARLALQLQQQQQQQHAGQGGGEAGEGSGGDAVAAAAAARLGVHTSVVAMLSWRYAQLLWVLPNRGGEAARWEGCARQFWAGSGPLAQRDIASVLGGQGHLRGEGPEGTGLLLSTRFRRAWLCRQPLL